MLYVSDAIIRIDQFVQELRNSMPATSTKVAGLLLRMKIQQIKREGVGKYSPKTYSAHFLKGKQLNNLGKTFIESKIKKKEKTNWAELRKAQGLQTQYVDVYYSGQMIRSLGIESQITSPNVYYIKIGARNDEAKKKLEHNIQRYGNFLIPNKAQNEAMAKLINQDIANIYKRVLRTL